MNFENHTSLWIKTTTQPEFASSSRREFSIVIVGGGIVGVVLAFELRSRGADVLLIEGDELLKGVTGYTTGKLTAQHGLIYSKLESSRGQDVARAYWEAQNWAILHVDRLTSEHAIECDLVETQAHVFSTKPENDQSMQDEAQAYDTLSIPGRLHLDSAILPGVRRTLVMDGQRHFHPRKFLLGLLEIARQAGVVVIDRNRVHEINEESDQVVVTTEIGEFKAEKVIVASHYPVHDSGLFVTKLTPNRSYAMAFRMDEMPAEGMFVSHDAETLHSWRPAMHFEEPVLIVGANEHKVGETPDGDPYASLEVWARSQFKVDREVARWSTQDNMTPDGVPFIGQSPLRDRIWLATGFGGWGMTNGVIAAIILSDLIDGKENLWSEVFSPSRFGVDMIPKLVKDNIKTVGHLIGDRLSSVEEIRLEQVLPGRGVVAEMDGDRRAIYRDQNGTTCILNPACTHMGCQVAWNDWESTWDCPCHGSRFKATGEVIHGPATRPLARIEQEKD